MSKKVTQEEFIARSIAKHGLNTFGYDKAIYINNTEKITLYCNTCNVYFDVNTKSHLCGTKHKTCSIKQVSITRTKSIDYYINKSIDMYGDVFDFTQYIYINDRTLGIVICKSCGHTMLRTMNHHTNKRLHPCKQCPTTWTRFVTAKAEFVQKAVAIHGDTYLYDKAEDSYKGKRSDGVLIECRIHGYFHTDPSNHLSGAGCKNVAFQDHRSNVSIL